MHPVNLILLTAIAVLLTAQTIMDSRAGAIHFWGRAVYRRANPVVFRRMMAGRLAVVIGLVGALLLAGIR